MKSSSILGLILIVAGIVLLGYGGFANFATKENVAKVGPVEINKSENHSLPIGPIVGGLCIVGGIIVMLSGRGGRSV